MALSEVERRLEAAEADAYRSFASAMPADLARTVGLSVAQLGGVTVLTAPGLRGPLLNRAFGFGLTEAPTEAGLDAVLEHARQAGAVADARGFYVQPAPGVAADMAPWLAARGLVVKTGWSKFEHPRTAPLAVATDLELFEADATQADGFGAVVCAGFGMPPAMVPWLAALVGRDGWRVFLARDGGRVVACGALWRSGDVAWLGIGATLESHRRRGAQGAIMGWRIREAIAGGATCVTTETGSRVAGKPSPSYDNMVRLGFAVEYERLNFG